MSSGTTSSVVCGIDWVTANAAAKGIKVANMSLGGGGKDDGNCGNTNGDVMHQAICKSVNDSGVTYVVAAGNGNTNFAGTIPASYNEVLTVTAIADYNGQPVGLADPSCSDRGPDDTPATFSNWTTSGSSDVGHTIAAPGVCIYSTYKSGGYETMNGTSMASPHVAGAVVTCLVNGTCTDTNNNGKIDPAEAAAKLRTDASNQPSTYGYTYSGSNHYDKLAYGGSYRTSGGGGGGGTPAAPTIGLEAASDTGRSNTDRVTSNKTPTFTGTAGANNTVTIYDGTTAVCTTTAGASGSYICAVPTASALADGTRSITAKANDGSTTSPASAVLSVTIDTAAPGAPSITSPTSGSTINNNLPPFTGTAEANSTVRIYANNGSTPVCIATADASGNYSCTPGSALADGTYSFTATAEDIAGNASGPSAAVDNVTINTTAPDTTAPTVTSTLPNNGATGEARTISVTATFSEAMNSSTITTSSFRLVDTSTGTRVSATVSCDSPCKTAKLTPSQPLTANRKYKAVVTTAAKDLAGNAMTQNKVWYLTTGG